jgi:hypothetical protein
MMKVVATALVLIAGAAVVLWFGNTLNSWVLGGLIGGLAALLLSIPISLTLFSYLSRRHDEQMRAEAELAATEVYEYEAIPARAMRETYDAEGYALREGDEGFWDEKEYYQPQRALPRTTARNLPVPASQPMPAAQQGARVALPRPATRNMPAGRGKEAGGRRTTRQINTPANSPGFPGYEPGSVLRHHKSAALRAARIEKAQQYDDDVEVLPTHISRRVPSARPTRELTGQYEQMPRPRSSRQLSPQDHEPAYWIDPETENLSDKHYPHTEPVRRSTGQIGRNPHLDDRQAHNENPSGSLKKPLVRRAPYMYEDDPLRQELSQQLHPPRVRRSSRLEGQQHEEE